LEQSLPKSRIASEWGARSGGMRRASLILRRILACGGFMAFGYVRADRPILRAPKMALTPASGRAYRRISHRLLSAIDA
jgi:hypothetical protein